MLIDFNFSLNYLFFYMMYVNIQHTEHEIGIHSDFQLFCYTAGLKCFLLRISLKKKEEKCVLSHFGSETENFKNKSQKLNY